MKHIEIAEHAQARWLDLDCAQRNALLEFNGKLSLTPEPGSGNLWCLRASAHVGTVVIPGMTIRIRPKLSIARLFVMLSAASGSIRWNEHGVNLKESMDIDDLVAISLVNSIHRSLRGGLLRGYVTVCEESFAIRGRVDLAETFRRQPGVMIPVVQSLELLENNIPENRVLATALDRLSKRVSPAVQRLVVDCQRTLAEVNVLAPGESLPSIARTRLNAAWWSTIQLAFLVLRASGFELHGGDHASRSFLVDMNVVFEQFVYRALADALRPQGKELVHNRGGLQLDKGGLHLLRPDLSVWSAGRCIFAGDCKYKYTDDGLAQRDDLYQALAYSIATGLPSVMLVYAGSKSLSCDVILMNDLITIRVRAIDLGATMELLQAQLGCIAAEINHTSSGFTRLTTAR